MDISQIAKIGSPEAEMFFHEDPTKLHIGTQPDHCYFIPFGKEQDPFVCREKSRYFELLNGEWGFTYYDSIIDLPEDFVSQESKAKLPVPANWQQKNTTSSWKNPDIA